VSCNTILLLQLTDHKQQADRPHGVDFNVGTLSKIQSWVKKLVVIKAQRVPVYSMYLK